MLVQAVVNYDYTIADENIGWPGVFMREKFLCILGCIMVTAGELLLVQGLSAIIKAVAESPSTEGNQLSTKIPFTEIHTLHDNTFSYYLNDLVLI